MRDLQPTSDSMGKNKIFSTKIRNMTRLSTFTTSIQHSIGSPSHRDQTRRRNKRHPNWKGGSKTVTVWSVPRKSYRLHQKNTRSNKQIWQTAGPKVYIQKSKALLYTNNKISESEIRKKIPFPIPTRKIKYLGINFTKEVKDPYSENYRTLKKEIK